MPFSYQCRVSSLRKAGHLKMGRGGQQAPGTEATHPHTAARQTTGCQRAEQPKTHHSMSHQKLHLLTHVASLCLVAFPSDTRASHSRRGMSSQPLPHQTGQCTHYTHYSYAGYLYVFKTRHRMIRYLLYQYTLSSISWRPTVHPPYYNQWEPEMSWHCTKTQNSLLTSNHSVSWGSWWVERRGSIITWVIS